MNTKSGLLAFIAGVGTLGSLFGIESIASAHPGHFYVSPIGDTTTVDFNQSPIVPSNVKGNLPILNLPQLVNEVSGKALTETYETSGGLYKDIAIGTDTNNKYSFFEFYIPPGASTSFHTHSKGYEFFYVSEGTFKAKADTDGNFGLTDPNNPFSIDESTLEINKVLPKGSFVGLPAGLVHTWSNTGNDISKTVTLLTPSGIEKAFDLLGSPASEGVPTDPNFYDYTQIDPDLLPQILKDTGFTAVPASIPGALQPVVYDPSAGGPDPFESTFEDPFSVLTLDQTVGPLSTVGLEAELYGINDGEEYLSQKSQKEKLFYLLDGEMTVQVGDKVYTPDESVSFNVPANVEYSLTGTGDAKILEVTFTPIPEPVTITGTILAGLLLGKAKLRKRS